MSDQPAGPAPNLPPPPTTPPITPRGAPATHSAAAPQAGPKAPRPAIGLTGPPWVRPTFYYLACLIGILVGTWGAVNTAQGIVHVASPDIAQQGDPVARFATTILGLVDAGVNSAASQFEGSLDDESLDATNEVIEATEDELRSQARQAAIDELLSGLIFLGVGIALYLFHWRRVEPADPAAA